MTNRTIFGVAVAAFLAGCGSTSGHPSGPSSEHGMAMGRSCPMKVEGTKVVASELEGAASLTFTSRGDVSELRQRVHAMAEKNHGQHGGLKMAGHDSMPASTASVDDVEGGARVVLRPADPTQLAEVRAHVRMRAEKMERGECSMKSM